VDQCHDPIVDRNVGISLCDDETRLAHSRVSDQADFVDLQVRESSLTAFCLLHEHPL
jgi:hypothetical protein